MRAARNTALSAIVTGSRVSAVALAMLLLARRLGPGGFGEFTYAITLAGVFAVIPDYGFSLQVVRDIVAAPGRWHAVWVPATQAKIALAIVASVGVVGWLLLGVPGAGRHVTVLVVFASALALSFGQLNAYVFRGLDRFDLDAVSALVLNALFLVAVIAAVVEGGDALWAAFAYLGARVVYLVLTWIFLRRLAEAHLATNERYQPWWVVLREGFPYGLHAAVAVLYVSVDTLVLGRYYPVGVVGIYQAGMRLVFASMFVPEVLTSGLFPSFAKALAHGNRAEAVRLGDGMNRIMVLSGGAVASLLVLAPSFVRMIVFSSPYQALDPLLPWFGVIILLRFLGATYGAMVTAAGGQTWRTITGVTALFINGIGNLALVPRYGLIGAISVSVITHALLLGAYVALSWRLVGAWLLDNRTKVLGAGLCLAFAVRRFGPAVPITEIVAGLMVGILLVAAAVPELNRLRRRLLADR